MQLWGRLLHSIPFRFDDSNIIAFHAVSAADGSRDKIFLKNQQKFVELAKTANIIQAELPLANAGEQALIFEAPDWLRWPVKFDFPSQISYTSPTEEELKLWKQRIEKKGYKQIDQRISDEKLASIAGYKYTLVYQGVVESKKSVQVLFAYDRSTNKYQYSLNKYEVRCNSEPMFRQI